MYENDVDEDYKVGYCRPPVHTRFKKGQSGNPKGRPRGSKSFAELFHRIINQKIKVKGPHGAQMITKLEASLTQLANMAASGDKKAIRDLVQLRKSFPELQMPLNPPVFHIQFVDPKDGQLKDQLPCDDDEED